MTEAVRRAIHDSKESLRVLAKRCGIIPKTFAKWKKHTAIKDLPTGPRETHSTVLGIEEEAIIIACRKRISLPLDDCLYALQAYGPKPEGVAVGKILVYQNPGLTITILPHERVFQ